MFHVFLDMPTKSLENSKSPGDLNFQVMLKPETTCHLWDMLDFLLSSLMQTKTYWNKLKIFILISGLLFFPPKKLLISPLVFLGVTGKITVSHGHETQTCEWSVGVRQKASLGKGLQVTSAFSLAWNNVLFPFLCGEVHGMNDASCTMLGWTKQKKKQGQGQSEQRKLMSRMPRTRKPLCVLHKNLWRHRLHRFLERQREN